MRRASSSLNSISRAIKTKLPLASARTNIHANARAMHGASLIASSALAPRVIGGALNSAKCNVRDVHRAPLRSALMQKGLVRGFSVVAEAGDEDGAGAGGRQDEHRVYVGNLSWGVTDESLAELFSEFDVRDASVMKDRETGRSRGFAFVSMNNEEDVERASAALNGREVDGRELRVSKAQAQAERGERPMRMPRQRRDFDQAEGRRVYFGNLSWGMDQYDLQDLCSEFGSVEDSRLITDRDTGRSRGFGFVTMSNTTEADEVVAQLNGQDVDGRVLRVNIATSN